MYDENENKLPEKHLLEMHEAFRKSANNEIDAFLNYGSGWGALEQKREPNIIPQGLAFPEKLLGDEQYPFLNLLEKSIIPAWNGKIPSSYMCDSRWIKIIKEAISKSSKVSPELLFHYAIASYENGNFDEGISALKEAMENSPAPIISRTLGMMYSKLGDNEKAVVVARKSIDDGGCMQSPVFATDYIKLLIDAKQFLTAWDFFESLPEEIKDIEQIQVCASIAAYETEHWRFLKKQFSKEFVYMREGETQLVDLWYKYRARELSISQSFPFSKAVKMVKENESPPYEIDFGVYSKVEE